MKTFLGSVYISDIQEYIEGSQIGKQLCKVSNPSTMRDFLWKLIIIATAVVLPIYYFIDENPFDTASFLSLVSTRNFKWGKLSWTEWKKAFIWVYI